MLTKINCKKLIAFICTPSLLISIFPAMPYVKATTNTVERLEAYNYSGYYIRHSDFAVKVELNPAPIYDSRFIERAGLADSSCVSFESVNYPGYYLKHDNFILKLVKNDGTTLFQQDATFKRLSGLANSSYSSFQSYNYPTMYIRHSDFICTLTTISTDTDKADATFKITEEINTFNNPRTTSEEMPDPFVYKHTDGYYYGLHTVMENGSYTTKINLYKSASLSNLFTTGIVKTIYTASTSGWDNADIWAPELYRIDNVWYIYYSANCRFGAISCTSSDPMTGTWTSLGMVSADEWAIDASILIQNGNMYMLWSGQSSGQSIFIQKMSSPTTLTGSKVLLSSPTYDWERKGTYVVNEGPNILQRNGKTFCVYSASFCATQYYCLGMLTCTSTADPLVASNWTKSSVPVFQSSDVNGIWSVGHHSITTSPDGTQDWLVYHTAIIASPDTYERRYAAMQQFNWNSDGTPNFGGPVGRYNPIPRPSGE